MKLLLLMKSLNKTETPIFLSVVCSLFPKAIFLTFIMLYKDRVQMYVYMHKNTFKYSSPTYLPACLPIYLPTYLPTYLQVHPDIYHPEKNTYINTYLPT